MNKQQILNLLGLAYKAHCVVSGQDLVLKSLKQRQVEFVFLASDLSTTFLKKITPILDQYQVSFTTDFSQAELSQAIGRLRKTIAITDQGFAKRFKELTMIN